MENVQTVAEESEAVDSAKAEGIAANEAAGQARTYSRDEVDSIVKRRIDKQNASHAKETDGLNARIRELEEALSAETAEKDAMRRSQEVESWKAEASAETGVPQALLRGETRDEVLEHARAIKAAIKVAPSFRDSGSPAPSNRPTKEEILSIKSDRERIRAIKENIDIFKG